MESTDIAALLRPFIAITLEQKQLQQTSTYIDLLLRWNARINLTAVRRPKDIVTRHFGEAFYIAARLLRPGDSSSVADLGSGAGFPGLPVALLYPEAQVTLIESNTRKAAFLNEAIRTLGLNNATVFHGRGEDFTGQVALVTMRAVEKFDEAMPIAAGMVEQGGRLALMISKSQVDRAKSLAGYLNWADPTEIPGGHSRVLLVGTKLVKVD